MENFNLFKPILAKAKKLGPYRILGFSGDVEKWYYYGSKWSDEHDPMNASIKTRKTESDRMTKGELLVYDKGTYSLISKSLYRNTKGVYVKHKTEGALYFIKESVPESMK